MVTPSSRHHLPRLHRRLLCRCLRLPLRRLPCLALVEGGHWQAPTDQNGLIRGMLNVFCSCPMVRLKFFSQPEQRARRTAGGGAVRQTSGTIHSEKSKSKGEPQWRKKLLT